MNTFSEKTEQFLNNGISPISRSLAVAFIDQAGGEDDYIANIESSKIEGVSFNEQKTVIDFFEENKSEINAYLNLIKENLGEDFIASAAVDAAEPPAVQYSKADVIAVINEQPNPYYNAIIAGLVGLIANDLVSAYKDFLEIDESAYYVDGEEATQNTRLRGFFSIDE